MQKSVLDSLFLAECEDCDTAVMNEQYNSLREESCALYEKLYEKLSKEQIKILNEYADKLVEIEGLSSEAYYKCGVKAGMFGGRMFLLIYK